MRNIVEKAHVMERVHAATGRVRGHHLRALASIHEYIQADDILVHQAVDMYVSEMKKYEEEDYLKDVLGSTSEEEDTFKRSVGSLYQTVMHNPRPYAEIALLVGMKDDICLACQGGGTHCGNLASHGRATEANIDDGNCIRKAVQWIESINNTHLESYYIANRFILQAGMRQTRIVFTPVSALCGYISSNADKIIE